MVIKKDDLTTRSWQTDVSQSKCKGTTSVNAGFPEDQVWAEMYVMAEDSAQTWLHDRFPPCSKSTTNGK